jgi:alcohol dehydrogenase class IV
MSTILYLTTIEFGVGARKTLPRALNELAIKRPLVVSDRGVAAEGILDEATRAMDAVRFLDVPPNPTVTAVRAALQVYRDSRCDGIVAVGGGSPIDLAKGVALLASHPGPLEDYAAIYGGVARIGALAPVIAIPTTAGTGEEVGRAALLTLEASTSSHSARSAIRS